MEAVQRSKAAAQLRLHQDKKVTLPAMISNNSIRNGPVIWTVAKQKADHTVLHIVEKHILISTLPAGNGWKWMEHAGLGGGLTAPAVGPMDWTDQKARQHPPIVLHKKCYTEGMAPKTALLQQI